MRTAFLFLSLLAFLAPDLPAHGIVGRRMFIEPLVTEDANVKNEFVFPLAQFGVQPDGTWRQFGFSFEKQLYPERFSFALEWGRINRHDGDLRMAGWDNLEAGAKLEAYTSETREFVLSPALFVTVPVGTEPVVDRETRLKPMLLFGKGFGDLPNRSLRPFAVQGDIGIETSLKSPHEKELLYDTVLMYSIPYLNHWVRRTDVAYSTEDSLRRGFSRGALLGNFFPFIEFNGARPLDGRVGSATGNLRPGILWMGKDVQVSVAADIPVQSSDFEQRPHKGFIFSLDWFLDELFPVLNWTPFGKKPHP
jgi:hypothetical protein